VATSLVIATLLQTTLALYLPTTAPRPDFVLLVALAWGFLRGSAEGFVVAIVGGVLLDCLGTEPFGLLTLTLGLAALVVSGEGAFSGDVVRRSLGAMVAGAIVHLVALVVLQTRGWEILWPMALIRGTLPALLADAALLPLVYTLLRWLPEPTAEPGVGGS
jgi:rod shape-determining protein MreD